MANIGFMTCFEAWKYPDFEEFAFESNRSLLEYDIVLWNIEYLHFGYNLSFEHNASDLQRLLLDRKRRLHEIEVLLNNGKSLAILLSKSESLTCPFAEMVLTFFNFRLTECRRQLINQATPGYGFVELSMV